MGWKDIAHGVLNVAGFIPGVGAIADLANGAIYLSEGKYGEAALCAVAAIPGIGDSVALVSKGAKAAKALKGLSAAKKGAAVVKGLAGAGKNLLKSGIKSGKEILKLGKNIKFNKDFLKTSSKFLSSIPVVGDYFKLGKGVLKGLKSLKGLSRGEILSLLKGKGMKAWGKVKDGARSLKGKSPKELFNAFKNKCKEFFLFGKCFAEDTLVCTESGYLPMKEIKAGDAVYSRNEKTGETGFKRVEQVTKTKAHTLYTIELNGKTEITATAYHPFYIEERGWVNAINLREGDQLSVPEGSALVTLIKKDRYEEPVTMYNFHVEDWVSYYVTELKVYVHNGKKCGTDLDTVDDVVTYRRVQGGSGTAKSKPRISIDESGKVSIPDKKQDLYISVDSGEHSQYFKEKRPGADIVEFDVPKWLDDFVNESAISQTGYTSNPLNQGGTVPKITDVSTPGKSIDFPAPWIEWIEEYATNGRIIRGGP